MLFSRISIVIGLAISAFAYIPASPTNSTSDAIAGGLNVTDISQLHMQWYSNGSYSMHVSYQLAGFNSSGISKGVLVHFSEEKASNITPPTTTPWIALVSCDKNATNASMQEDIFTLARDKGAVSALLYSLYSVACVINPEYSNPATFDQVFDIFSSQSSTSSHVIEYQFGQLTPQNQSIFAYNSSQLNDSANDIVKSINTGSPVSPGYLLAVLQAYNATDNTTTAAANNDNGTPTPGSNNSPNTALAMIILYAITGCVSALFCIVIISGAIRAIRHPERYGPRARMGDDGGPPQSRARGLTRAILDTFPVVKFGSNQTPSDQHVSDISHEKEIRARDPGANIELGNLSPSNENASPDLHRVSTNSQSAEASGSGASANSQPSQNADPLAVTDNPSPSHPPSPSRIDTPVVNRDQSTDVGEGTSRLNPPVTIKSEQDDMVPASIGRETCPICIVDFEEGDDIRVLPCEGKHCFHQNCVDPWLLKLSSSCPICRQDFLALENMLSGHPDDHVEAEHPDLGTEVAHPRGHVNGGRFSRYLRFAHRRHRRGDEADPTDPFMPTAPETSMYSGV
ncbi:RING-7 protein [Flammula alnicola]|nr:RING-7 protein [Flammula alnicola]